MKRDEKFKMFLESMKTHNPALIEAITKGFRVCFEGMHTDGIDWMTDKDYAGDTGEVLAEKLIGRDITIFNSYFDTRGNNQQNIIIEKSVYNPETDSIVISGDVLWNDDIIPKKGGAVLSMKEAREAESYGKDRAYIHRQETP